MNSRSIRRVRNGEKGVALVLAIIVIFLLTVFGLALLFTTTTEFQIAGAETSINRSFYAADSGIQYALAQSKRGSITGPGCTTPDGTVWNNFWCFDVAANRPNAAATVVTVRVSPLREVDKSLPLYTETNQSGQTIQLFNFTRHVDSVSRIYSNPVIPGLESQKTVSADFVIGPLPDSTQQ